MAPRSRGSMADGGGGLSSADADALGADIRARSADCRGRATSELQPRHPADPLQQLLRLPRSGREAARDQVPLRHARRHVPRGGRDRAGQRREEPARQEDQRAECGGPHAAARLGACAHRQADRAAEALDRRGRAMGLALVLHGAGPPRTAGSEAGRLGAQSDRPVHRRPARARRPAALARGRQGHAAPPRHLRPHGAAADAGGDRRLRRRQIARRLREARRRAARVAALRRAHGDAVARRGALRRHARLSHRQPARHVALARLGHQRLQPQPAVRSVRDRAAGRRPAAGCDASSRRSPPGSIATT